MTALRITTFGGMVPRTDPRLIPDSSAQIASNCTINSGILSPVKRVSSAYVQSKPKPALAIFRAIYSGGAAWLTWPYDVDAVKMPMPPDVTARFAWTGDGEPRWGKSTDIVAGGDNDYPHSYYALGIPTPVTAPIVTPSGGSGTQVTRFYVNTFFSQDGEESGPSPVSAAAVGYPNGTWDISGMSAFPANTGTGTAAYASGETTFTNAASASHWLRVGDEVVISGDTLTVTAIPAAYSFKVAGDYSAATSWARKAYWNTTGMKRRLYRTAGTASGFQLVHDDVGTSYSDTLSDTAIMGDEIISEGWKPPPAGLRGLMVTAYGALAGFVGSEYRESEPYQGHAWPDTYAYRTSQDIVAIAPMGSATGIGTMGTPYVAIGSGPATKALIPVNMPYPCLSKRGMVSDGDGAIYPSNVGLVRINQSAQASVFTEKWFTQRNWEKKGPSTMVCAVGPGRLYVIYEANSRKSIMVFDMTIGELTENATEADDIYVDESAGSVYVSNSNGISALIGGEYPEQQAWKSKEFVLPKPVNFGAAKVRFEDAIDSVTQAAILAEIAAVEANNAVIYAAGNLKGAVNSHAVNTRAANGSLYEAVPDLPPNNTVTFTLFVDGAEKYTKEVTSIEPFRLPSGYLGNLVSVQVSSACDIHGIEMAETMLELEQA